MLLRLTVNLTVFPLHGAIHTLNKRKCQRVVYEWCKSMNLDGVRVAQAVAPKELAFYAG